VEGLYALWSVIATLVWLFGKSWRRGLVVVSGKPELAGIVSNQNEHFREGFPGQNYFECVAAPHFDRCLSISRVIHGNDPLAVQKHLVAACFVCASTVPVGNCQNTAAIGHGINSKVIRSSARFVRRTCKEELHVNAGRLARVLLWMRHGCLLSRQMGGTDETQEDDNKPICLAASSKRFRAHFRREYHNQWRAKLPVKRQIRTLGTIDRMAVSNNPDDPHSESRILIGRARICHIRVA